MAYVRVIPTAHPATPFGAGFRATWFASPRNHRFLPGCPSLRVAAIGLEWWPASNRNGGRDQIGTPGRHALKSAVIAVDTSCSIDDAALTAFAAEITAIFDQASSEAIDVVYCDAVVKDTACFTPGDMIGLAPLSGGGTAFGPVFEWEARSNVQPVCAVYRTDLDGRDFRRPPDYPVSWSAHGRPSRRSGN